MSKNTNFALQNLLQKRKHAHRASVKHPDNADLRQRFRDLRRQGVALNKQLRSKYYQGEFHAARSSPRQHWKILNKLLGRHHVQATLPVEVADLTTTFKNLVTDVHFTSPLQCPFGPAPCDSMSTPTVSASQTEVLPAKGGVLGSFTSFTSPSANVILPLFQSLPAGKATGPDGIPPAVLKLCAEELADPASQLFSESLATGHFPSMYKSAHVIPVFKKGDKSDPCNYRPVSILPASSKLLERLVLNQVKTFIKDNSDLCILPPQQFAYRNQHSCEDALALCINNWQIALDNGLFTGVVFLDLSKAFDSVAHHSLLLDLQACGFGGDVLHWFTAYLGERQQCVRAPNMPAGECYACTQGVPQGSVLGPLLFTIYIRSLPHVLRFATCSLYADDICLYVSGKDVQDVMQKLESDLVRVQKFLTNKGLQLNETKTQFLMIRKKTSTSPPPLQLSSLTVSPSESVKYLGLVIDEFLSFSTHVDSLTSRVYAKLKAFRRVRNSLNVRARRTFYISFIQSMLEYASNAYVHCLHTATYDKLIKLSKRAQRYVFGYPHRAHTSPIRSRQSLSHSS